MNRVQLSRFAINTIGQILIFSLSIRIFYIDTTIYFNYRDLMYYGSLALLCVASILYCAIIQPAKKKKKKNKEAVIDWEVYANNKILVLLLKATYHSHKIVSWLFYGYLFALLMYVYSGEEALGYTYISFIFAWGFYACSCLLNIADRFLQHHGIIEKVSRVFLSNKVEITRFVIGLIWHILVLLLLYKLFFSEAISANMYYYSIFFLALIGFLFFIIVYPADIKEKNLSKVNLTKLESRPFFQLLLKVSYNLHEVISCIFFIFFLVLARNTYLGLDDFDYSFELSPFAYGMYVCSCLRNTTKRFLKRYNIDEKL